MVQYKDASVDKFDHPFNYWLNFGAEYSNDNPISTLEEALHLIANRGARMTKLYRYPLKFRILVTETKELEQYTIKI